MDIKAFLESPTLQGLEMVKKDDLIKIATKLNLTEVKQSMRKAVIHRMIVDYYLEKEVFELSEVVEFPESKSVISDVTFQPVELEDLEEEELEQLEEFSGGESERPVRQVQIAKMELEQTRLKVELGQKRLEAEREQTQLKLEAEQKITQMKLEAERERELTRMKIEADLAMKQMELKRMELDSEEKEKQRQHDLQMMQKSVESDSDDGFSASREVRLVPPFEEDQVDQYFQHFEKVAVSSNWPRKGWALMVQSVIKGKAQKAYSALSAEDAADYTKVKQAILKAYELVPEAYRQKFRDLRKSADQTYMEFANGKRICFERWYMAKNVDGDFDKLTELILVEDFKRCVPAELTTYLNEKAVETLQETARLADDYALTHKSKWGQPKTFQKSTKTIQVNRRLNWEVIKKGKDEKKPGLEKPVERTCYYCRKPGHVISNCALLKKKKEAGPNACFQTIKNQKGLGDAVKDQSLQEGKAEKLEEVEASKLLFRQKFKQYLSSLFPQVRGLL
ncbi:cilia- and flagella-associated protein 45-like isoform X2 [Pristis pectinata]|uniref:cilia- and flagella-associated protein 45-like isoform X2 n=1 Tax=Pristis pectinata TaxID=685728 RepID=UPI00223DAEB1|nr:cilia- and flagella-associated protein 45-like isoform X2 [Pristis pectinata]